MVQKLACPQPDTFLAQLEAPRVCVLLQAVTTDITAVPYSSEHTGLVFFFCRASKSLNHGGENTSPQFPMWYSRFAMH